MADTKISALTALTAPVGADLLPIVDVSDTSMAGSGTTKRITKADLGPWINVKDHGAVGDGTTNDYTAIAAAVAAVPATGGTVFFPPGVYATGTQILVDAKNVDLVGPGATIKATAALASVVRYTRVTTVPGVGVHGMTIDMNSTASIGLEVKNCWLTEHEVQLINPVAGTGAKIHTDDIAFGVYYNKVRARCVGNETAGSIGVLVQGASGANQANANIVSGLFNDLGTGVKIGSNCGANFLDSVDCTSNDVGYDFTSGITRGVNLWEEANVTYGFVARNGANARLLALYHEKRHIEPTTGTGVLRVDDAYVSYNQAVDREWQSPGNAVIRERVVPDAGRIDWIADSIRTFFSLSFDGWFDMPEVTAPAAPAANTGRVFFRDNGSGKTQLCCRFATGAIQVLATEP